MEIIIEKIDNYYKLETEKGIYRFFKPIPDELKIMTLEIIKKFPREIKEQILHRVIVDFIRDEYIFNQTNRRT